MRARMRTRNTALGILAAATLALTGCGGDDPPSGGEGSTPPAQASRAAPSPIADGTATLDVSRRVDLLLGAAGVDVVPTGTATESDEGIELPISEGELGVEPLAGRLALDGGIRFGAAGQAVEATALELDLRSGEVTAEIEGLRVPLLSAEFEPAQLGDNAASVVVPGTRAALSDEAVAPLNDALGVDLLSGGLSVGELTVEARWP